MDKENPVPLKLTCEDVIGMLLEYLETRLDTPTLTAFERHLAVCPPCIAYLNTYRRTRELAATSGRVEMPDEMKTRLSEFLLTQLRAGADPHSPAPGRRRPHRRPSSPCPTREFDESSGS